MRNEHDLSTESTSRRDFLAASVAVGLSAAATTSAIAQDQPAKKLRPLAFQPLPLGQIKPAGWLLYQLKIQAAGLGGHLDEFWPDVRDSAWVGGKAEGWERGPYWLDGFLPLAILLDDSNLKARAKRWIDHILSTQREDGWLGPVSGNPSQASKLKQYDVWPRFIVLKALTQWQEATGDERVVPAMTKFFTTLGPLLDKQPLDEWARARWADLVLSIHWLYDRTGDAFLLDLAEKAHKQGLDWAAFGRDFPYKEKVTDAKLKEFQKAAGGKPMNDHYLGSHGVNMAMGWKAPGVWFRQSNNDADRKAVHQMLAALDHYHGQATGIFTCDEHLAGRNPSQGTETCTVVEAMFSLEQLIAILGDVALADRLERIAFNALPAAFKPDMTARQYDQQANQAICKVSQERIYTNNGPEANLFGLETNFGCCTANFHQGWPKFVSHVWMKTPDGGLAAISYAPCVVETEIQGKPVRVEVKTEYPFSDDVEIKFTTKEKMRIPVNFRIPSWWEDTVIAENTRQNASPAKAGTFERFEVECDSEREVKVVFIGGPRSSEGFGRSSVLSWGPLVFALPVGAEWKKLRGNEPFADWEVLPTSAWNYALELDNKRLKESAAVEWKPIGERPFSPEGAPVFAKVKGRNVPSWKLERNAAAPPPPSPVETSEPLEELTLVPYGCTSLRITEFPTVK
jgi:uncharacterized protein